MASERALEFLCGNGYQILATRLDATADFFKCDLTVPTAIVLGNEATGLSNRWSSDDCKGIRLPMMGSADSLNISSTTAVVVYETLRQIQSTNSDT